MVLRSWEGAVLEVWTSLVSGVQKLLLAQIPNENYLF
jgi:hypothetical protein